MVNDASSPRPWRRMSSEKNVIATMKKGERRIAMVLGTPLGKSSKRTLTTKKPAEIDSMSWRSHTMSLGSAPPSTLSSMLREPIPFRVPKKFASMNSSAAMTSL